MIPKINSSHGAETMNIINRVIEVLNQQGKSLQDLVAEGQLTEEQYAELITVINGLIKSGHVDKSDLTSEFKDEIEGFSAQLAETAKKDEVISELKKKRDKSARIGVNDLDGETLGIIQDGTGGTPINVLADPRPHSVGFKETTFIETSSNLFNKDDVTHGFSVDFTTGEPVANSANSLSGFIEVEPGTTYSHARVNRFGMYDGSKNFITSHTVTPYTMPENVYYVRLAVTTKALDEGQFSKGETLPPYEPYYAPRFTDASGLGRLKKGSVTSESIAEKAVELTHLDFVEYSTNLLDVKTLENGYAINATTGEPTPNSNHSISDFMEVKPNTFYTKSFEGRWAWYDENQEYIGTHTITTITTPSEARFIRVAVHNAYLGDARINEGQTVLPYEPYYRRLTGITNIGEKDEEDEGSNTRNVETENFYVKKLNADEVYTAPMLPDYGRDSPDYFKEWLHTDIYAMYDELATSYPDYVTKQLLGEEATGKEIYRYDFSPPRTETSGVKIPKIFLAVGVHGSEKTAVWATIQLMKQICDNWRNDPALEYLRWNVHFIIVPIVNPWGWDWVHDNGNRTGTRKNSNGVDLARNYPTGFVAGTDPTSATYSGTSPLSELEAQYCNAILEGNKDELIYVTEFHNFFTRNGSLWNAAATNFQINLGEHLVNFLSRKWKKEHDFMPQDETTLIGLADLTAPRGSLGVHATSFGIHGGTFEISEYCPWETIEGGGGGKENSPLAIKFGMDVLANWLSLVIKNSMRFNEE